MDGNGEAPLSRRGFLGVSAAMAVTGLGAALLGGCQSSSNGGSESEGSSFPFTSSTTTSNAGAIATVSKPKNWDGTYNVVVCGSGSGLVAACRCAQLGAKVLVLEKQAEFGGSSKESSVFHVMGSKTQQALYAQQGEALSGSGQDVLVSQLQDLAQADLQTVRERWYEAYLPRPGFGLPKELAQSAGLTLPDGSVGTLPAQTDRLLLKSLVSSIPEMVDYLATLGVVWSPVTTAGPSGYVSGLCPKGQETGGYSARADYALFEILFNKAQELGVEVILNREVTSLVSDDDGNIIGVCCDDLYYRSIDGVLLATGGMANNEDLLTAYCPDAAKCALTTSVMGGDTGAGIRMGMGAGAALAGYDSFIGVDGGVVCDSWTHYLYRGDVQLARQPWLGIDVRGDRYPYYPLDAFGITRQGGIEAALPGRVGYVIFGHDYKSTIAGWESAGVAQRGSRRPISKTMGAGAAYASGNFSRMPSELCANDYTVEVDTALDAGYIVTGDTYEELASALGLPVATLQTAIEGWNAVCEKGVDEVCHFDPAWLVPILAPYHACRVGMACLATTCGLAVLPSQQVVSTDGKPISGLYAAGCTMGGESGAATFGDCRHPGGGVAMACGTAYNAANNIMGVTG